MSRRPEGDIPNVYTCFLCLFTESRSPPPPSLTLVLTLLAYVHLYIYIYRYHFYIWLMKSARRRNEIVPKTAGKLCNREEPGPVYILYRRVAQHTEFVISEAGSFFFFFFFSRGQQLAW